MATPLTYHSGVRGLAGFLKYITGSDGVARGTVVPAVSIVDSDGNAVGGTGGGPATIADGADQATGAKADAAATTDTGTFSLIALFKRSLGYLSTIAGGIVPALTATTDRSGTATTTSGGLNVAANSSRKFLVGQNISAVSIGFNEQGGTAAIGAAGTYTVAAGASFSISTNKLVNFIAASATAAVTLTEG